jgi:hypothetical protein
MKTIILLGALVISSGAIAQTRVQAPKMEAEKVQSEINQNTETGLKAVEDRVEQSKEEVKKVVDNSNVAVEEAKAYINDQDKTEMVEKKISQGRSAVDAKLKATQVKTEDDADAMIRMSKEDTKETMNSVQAKMLTARTKLSEKLASGEITQAQFDEKMVTLMDFEKRKNSIVEKMN